MRRDPTESLDNRRGGYVVPGLGEAEYICAHPHLVPWWRYETAAPAHKKIADDAMAELGAIIYSHNERLRAFRNYAFDKIARAALNIRRMP